MIEGNAIIDGATYFSILIGTILGAHITSPNITVGILVFCSLVGMLSSFKIPSAPAPRPDLSMSFNIFKTLR